MNRLLSWSIIVFVTGFISSITFYYQQRKLSYQFQSFFCHLSPQQYAKFKRKKKLDTKIVINGGGGGGGDGGGT